MHISRVTPTHTTFIPNPHCSKKGQVFVLFGVETHVCVLQTTLALCAAGQTVYVVVDGVSSQRTGDRRVALRRIEKAGGILTTAESLAMEILEDSKHESFRAHGKLNKEFKQGLAKLGGQHLANL